MTLITLRKALLTLAAKAVLALVTLLGTIVFPQIVFAAHPITVVASFNEMSGYRPSSSVVLDSHGNLYGTTNSGGKYGVGTVYEIAKGSRTITALVSFHGVYYSNATGAGVIVDSRGNLYGTNSRGGPSGLGTVYEIANGSHTMTTLASFNGMNGADPIGVVLDRNGNLFGTTYHGGILYPKDAHSHNNGDAKKYQGELSDYGTVVEIVKGSRVITVVATFNAATGSYPCNRVSLDSKGNLYGITAKGGRTGYGGIYKIAKGSHTITQLAAFDGTTGANPWCDLTVDTRGNVFGTQPGSGHHGIVFEIVKGTNTIKTLASFEGTNGDGPVGGVVLDQRGSLFGSTAFGGAYGNGIVYKLARGSHTITGIASFNRTNGFRPDSRVTLDGRGNLFGTTPNGGVKDAGVVYEIAGAGISVP